MRSTIRKRPSLTLSMVVLALLIFLKCGENILWTYLIQSTTPHTENYYVMDRLSEVSDIQSISPDDIENVLKQQQMGKSAGADHIHAEHLIHASDRLTVLSSILCTSIMKCIIFIMFCRSKLFLFKSYCSNFLLFAFVVQFYEGADE